MKSLLHLLRNDFSAQVAAVIILLLCLYPFVYGFPLGFIGWDTFGYYLYLPQLFIEGDVALSSVDAANQAISHYQLSDMLYQAHPTENGNHVIQYSAGMALIFAPFFFIGHFFAWVLDYPMDGYSLPYTWALIIGGYFYTIAGILLLRKVLLNLFTTQVASWTLIIILLGTNYLNIQTQSLGMPHIYLFAFYAALILYTIKWHKNPKKKYALIIGVLLGWMILIRPTEIFAIFIPLLWGVYNKESLKIKLKLIRDNLNSLFIISLSAIVLIAIQLVYWKYTTDQFVYYSYRNPGEGINLDRPHLKEFLFSYRKGWFLYTPLMLLPFAGVLVSGKSYKKWWLPFAFFAFFTIYVSACWSAWWYAASFSQRTMVQSYPVFALGLAAFVSWIYGHKRLKYFSGTLILLLIGLNIFQSWQFLKGILPPDRITKEYYWEIFGKTELPEGARDLLSIDRSTAVFNENELVQYWSGTFENVESAEADTKVYALSADQEWGEGVKVPYEETSNQDYCWYKIEFDAMVPEGSIPGAVELIAHLTYIDQPYGYTAYPLVPKDTTVNAWNHYEFHYISPHPRTPEDRLITFIWGHQQEAYYKHFKVTSFVEKQ